MQLNFSERSSASLHLCNSMGAELFVDGRLNSCPSNPFMTPAWCVKIGKKTQPPSLEPVYNQSHKNADEHTILLDTSLLEADPEKQCG